jgi:trans-2,3-dihydro-3-hydroxyanthranilate isomerase
MAAHLGLDASAIDSRHPCCRVDVGVEFVMVPLRDLASLRAAQPASLPAGDPGRMLGVLAFAPQTYEPGGDLAARVFFEAFGIREDPATGSAAACLAAYLSAQRYFGSERVKARVQQGYEVGRPSCLYIGAEPRDGTVAVNVAGKVALVARGEIA